MTKCRAPRPRHASPTQRCRFDSTHRTQARHRQRRRRRLEIVPVTFRQASDFITTHHRHHRPPQGMKFALGVAAGGHLVGAATIGRPLARHLDDGRTAEVTRTCTDGTTNANSALYGAAWRAARALGYLRLITYTQHTCRTCSHADQAHAAAPGSPSHPQQEPPGPCISTGCSCAGYAPGETGASLRAAGFQAVADLPAHQGWHRPGRPRTPQKQAVTRTRWEIATHPDLRCSSTPINSTSCRKDHRQAGNPSTSPWSSQE
ncbi:XF1762 family protein [Streptomyces phytophilus]|uniref:XF1762 family protein n=1 Tax=Streptomyces phytophilus TaxID=722715 RepID=UPI0035A950DB